ncbi:WLM domain [Phytophthora cactorum]|nr:WLM domain [Phytophthora cactorum]
MTTSFGIAEIKALVRQPQRAQAQQLLERLAAAVLPILTRRRFRVRRLREFFPKDGALLGMNVNRGAKIYVRRSETEANARVVLSYEALLETLLHELTHMVHGPHNEAFYQYLEELKQEMEALMVRGLVGEEDIRFADAGAGQRLGGNNISVPIRVAAVLAAKRREQYNSLLGGQTSRRLGSTSSGASNEVLDPEALRRKMLEAAERRRRDYEHCQNVLHTGASHEVLGIDSSDEDEGSTTGSDGDSRQQASSSSASEIVVLEENDATARRVSNRNVPAIVDLVDDDDEEKRDDTPSRPGRKRKREDTTDIIDLT